MEGVSSSRAAVSLYAPRRLASFLMLIGLVLTAFAYASVFGLTPDLEGQRAIGARNAALAFGPLCTALAVHLTVRPYLRILDGYVWERSLVLRWSKFETIRNTRVSVLSPRRYQFRSTSHDQKRVGTARTEEAARNVERLWIPPDRPLDHE